MNERIKSLFFLIKDNSVVIAESNLKDLIKDLPQEISNIRTYDYFYRQFQNSNYFQFEFNKSYFFQKIEYQKK